MGIFRNFLSKLLNLDNSNQIKTNVSSMSLNNPIFNSTNDVSANGDFMSAVFANARYTSKVEFNHELNGIERKNSALNNLLKYRPNPLMSPSVFWETARINYDRDTNLFIYVDYDNYGTVNQQPKALYVIDPLNIEVFTNDNGVIYYKFIVGNRNITVTDDSIILISKFVDTRKSELFGNGNNSILSIINLIDTNYQGIENAIENSAFVRFLVKASSPLPDARKKKMSETFSSSFLNKENKTGVIVLDGSEDLSQINHNNQFVKFEEITTFLNSLYKYLGVNEAILTSNYTEDQFQAYYESAIEPFILKVTQELEYKLFTQRQIAQGNRIGAKIDRIQTASLKSRIQMATLLQNGPIHTPNEVRKILGVELIDGGDEVFRFLNYENNSQQLNANETNTEITTITGGQPNNEQTN